MKCRPFAAFCAAVLAVPAFAQPILYVNAGLTTGGDDGSSWADAFRGPQALKRALDAAVPGSSTQIWAAAGRYTPAPTGGSRRAAYILKPGVSIYGGFAGHESSIELRDPVAHLTTISADLNGDDHLGREGDNTIHLVIADAAVDDSARVDGFTITGGNAWGVDGGVGVSDTEGGNILIRGGSPRFVGCIIRDAFASDGGGAAVLDGGGPVFERCTFTGNSAQGMGGAAWNAPRGRARFLACSFIGNRGGNGAGLANGGVFPGGPLAAAFVEDCLFESNRGEISLGAGPGAYDTSGAVITRCTFRDNRCPSGGGGLFCDGSTTSVTACRFIANEGSFDGGDALYITSGASPTFTSCEFFAHSGPGSGQASGATVIVGGSSPIFTSCTFANNNLAGTFFGVGVIYSFGPDAVLTFNNCIFWNNRDRDGAGQSAALFLQPTAAAFVNHSIVQGWTGSIPGTATFAADPRFADLDGPDNIAGTPDDDLRLSAASPAIDSADSTALPPAPAFDVAGLPRFIDDPATPDTGAGPGPASDRGAHEFIPDCRADLTSDGLIDFADYLRFLTLFDDADPAVDFTLDGLIDFADYLEFINRYEAGC